MQVHCAQTYRDAEVLTLDQGVWLELTDFQDNDPPVLFDSEAALLRGLPPDAVRRR